MSGHQIFSANRRLPYPCPRLKASFRSPCRLARCWRIHLSCSAWKLKIFHLTHKICGLFFSARTRLWVCTIRTHKTCGLLFPTSQDLPLAPFPLAFRNKKTPGPLLPFRKKVPGVLRHITCLSYSNLCQRDDQAFWHMFSSNEELCVIFHTKCISKPLDFDFLYEISYKNDC